MPQCGKYFQLVSLNIIPKSYIIILNTVICLKTKQVRLEILI